MRIIYNDFCNFNDIEILSYLVASITEKDNILIKSKLYIKIHN